MRHIVSIEIGPTQTGAGQHQRIELVREVDGLSLLVAVEAEFESGLRGAEQVVHDAEPRREILPDGHRDRVESP